MARTSITLLFTSMIATGCLAGGAPTESSEAIAADDDDDRASAGTLYVSPTGDDTLGDGSSAKPFKTIEAAVEVVQPGQTILVRDGVYTSNGNAVATITDVSGTPDAWIKIIAEHRHAAILDGQNNKSLYGFLLAGDVRYLSIQGFQVRNTKTAGVYVQGLVPDDDAPATEDGLHDLEFHGNWIHHIARVMVADCTDGYGRAGGYTNPYVYNVRWSANLIHDIGRIPNPACVTPPNDHNYRHDHGLYLQGSGHRVVNNIFYNMYAGWGVKIDGHFHHHDQSASERTHTLANNTFAFPANPNGTGHVTMFNNATVSSKTGEQMADPHNVLIQNNIFYDPPKTKGDTAIRVGNPSNIVLYSGTLIRNNITTAASIAQELTLGAGENAKVTRIDNVKGDPGFADVDPSAPDFHIGLGSPATGSGTSEGLSTRDFENSVRSRPDMGALVAR